MNNRAERRRFYKRHRNKLGLGSWDDFKATQIPQAPYVNKENYEKCIVCKKERVKKLIDSLGVCKLCRDGEKPNYKSKSRKI